MHFHYYYLYFITNEYNTVLYIGITNSIVRRIGEHKLRINKKSFPVQYNCTKLVYFEEYSDIRDCISREKQLKNWKRKWKNELVNAFNPEWKDLAEDWEYGDSENNGVSDQPMGDCGSPQ